MNAIKPMAYALLGALAVSVGPQTRLQGQSCGTCGPSCALTAAPSCAPRCDECCTVLAPRTVIQYCPRTITCFRQQICERMITIYRDVPTTKTVEEEYTVMVPELRRRTVEDTINRPVYRDVELRITSMAPQIEARQAKQTVYRYVPVHEERTVFETADNNAVNVSGLIHTAGYEREMAVDTAAIPAATTLLRDVSSSVEVESPAPPSPPPSPGVPTNAGTCNSCDCCAPTVIQRKVCVTCMKAVPEQVTIEYPVTHFQPTARAQTVSFYVFQPEKVAREEEYTVEVPQTRTRTREVTVMRTIAEQHPEKYTVLAPYEKVIQVPVPVLVWVPQPAAPCCNTCDGM